MLSSSLGNAIDSKVAGQFTIYATGSLARREASKFSDLDAFFYVLGDTGSRLDTVDEVRIFNEVIQSAKACSFPDFSGGGEYLQFQFLEHVVHHIGSREDDYINGLTSRMLLMLESCYLHNDEGYRLAREKVVERYFVDFHDHSDDFRPIFILNDVLRFWRTLCLNYEHGREWRKEDAFERSKGHLKNLKLRFSRLLICYSFIASLLNEGPAICTDRVLRIADMTPTERLEALKVGNDKVSGLVDEAIERYDWFLSQMNRPKEEALDWIGNETNRLAAFVEAKNFVNVMYQIVNTIANQHDYGRFLVI